jgi:hypothetical protein
MKTKKPSKLLLMVPYKFYKKYYTNKSIIKEGKIPITTFNAIATTATA